MARPSFSVRFPAELAKALDRIAEHRGQSRSDLVEMVIKELDAEDREMVLKTTVTSAPTEKRNLRLSPDALTRLKQLAGDLEPADFLRRTVACVVAMAPPEWYQTAAQPQNGHGATSSRTHRGAQSRSARGEDQVDFAAAPSGVAALAVLAVLVIGALVTLIVWLIFRRPEPPSPGPGNDRRGPLPDGTAEPPRA
jgi:hypothetical protein